MKCRWIGNETKVRNSRNKNWLFMSYRLFLSYDWRVTGKMIKMTMEKKIDEFFCRTIFRHCILFIWNGSTPSHLRMLDLVKVIVLTVFCFFLRFSRCIIAVLRFDFFQRIALATVCFQGIRVVFSFFFVSTCICIWWSSIYVWERNTVKKRSNMRTRVTLA